MADRGNNGSQTWKAQEGRMRRALERRGYVLTRSRLRDEAAPGYGKYCILERVTGAQVAGIDRLGNYTFTLDDVQAFVLAQSAQGTLAL